MANKDIDELLERMRRATDLVQEGKADDAAKLYRIIVARARKAGIESSHLHWAFAVACDYSGDMEMAFEQVTAAIAKDPLALPYRQSFGIITDRIKAALADPDRAPDDASTPRLYALLQRGGVADVASHLAMARYHLATGKPDQACALVDAVVLLHPTSREAWELKATIADAAGDTAAAEAARVEAAALAAGDPAFGVPGPASA